MMSTKKIALLLFTSFLLVACYWGYSYLTGDRTPLLSSDNAVTLEPTTVPSMMGSVDYAVEVFVSDLQIPWSIVFTSPTRVLVTERAGDVRLIENGVVRKEPMISFAVSTQSEEGLMGLTLDPEYASNKYVYVSYAYETPTGSADRVVRLVDEGSQLRVDKTLIEGIPAAQFHAGSRIKFGPDDKLYITTGDATKKELAQNTNSLAGKILRINRDGSIPSDNPFAGSAVWSYGHRNPQGIAWHPTAKTLWETEHGPSGNDGPGGGDEVNVIVKGGNYGWSVVSHGKHRDGMIDPLIVYTPAIAPGSGSFYTGDVFPQLKNSLLYGGLRGEGIYRAAISNDGTKVLLHDKLNGIAVGRVRDVITGPDGYIYFSTSNRDGRGKVQTGDDKIYRLVPKK
jgi:glucose/arabinose dehydrogenase